MADLRIVDAPEIPTEDITGEEKLPTGGSGNYSITLDSVADYTKTKKDLADNTSVDGKVGGVRQELNTHIEDLLNPHQVTKGQIGLGNVDNTADADKPVSNSTQAAIISAVSPKADKAYVDNQLTLKANKVDVYTKSESSDLVNNSISTALTPVNSSLDLAKRGIANRYDSSLAYNSGERVVLTNGDIVKSTIDENANDPNVDMTGWQFDDNTVKSIADLLAIQNPKDGQVVRAISFHTPITGATVFYGGGLFRYNSNILNPDNVLTFKSNTSSGCWVRVLDTDYLTPEMGGAQGVGDDRPSISKVIRVASKLKMKIKGLSGRTYTIASYDFTTGVNMFFTSPNYLDFDLNGSTIKVADNIGDYHYIFYTTNNHDCAAIYNGTINQNTMNNPPITDINPNNNARVVFGNYSTNGKLFKVHDVVVDDALGVWQFVCNAYDKCVYHDNTINYSAVNCTHTDRTSLYIIAKETHVYNNKFIGDVFGNATTAVELHSSNSHMYNNLVHGFRSALFIAGDNADKFTKKMENIFVYDNIFTNVQNGILIWTEPGLFDKDYYNINIERNTILLNTRRLTNETLLVGATGIGTLRSGWVSQKISNLTISKNRITLVKNPENVSTGSASLLYLYSEVPDPNFYTYDCDISENIFDNPIDIAILIGTNNAGTKQYHANYRLKIRENTFINMGTTHAIKFNNINLIGGSIIKDNNYGTTAVPFAAYTTLNHNGNIQEGLTISETTYPMYKLGLVLPRGAELHATARYITIGEINLIKALQGSTVRAGVSLYTQTSSDWNNPVWSS